MRRSVKYGLYGCVLAGLAGDGKQRAVWVNATSVDQALTQLGYGRNAFVSVSRFKRLDDGSTRRGAPARGRCAGSGSR